MKAWAIVVVAIMCMVTVSAVAVMATKKAANWPQIVDMPWMAEKSPGTDI